MPASQKAVWGLLIVNGKNYSINIINNLSGGRFPGGGHASKLNDGEKGCKGLTWVGVFLPPFHCKSSWPMRAWRYSIVERINSNHSNASPFGHHVRIASLK